MTSYRWQKRRTQPEYALHCVVVDYLNIALDRNACIWRSSLDGARLTKKTADRHKRINAIVPGWPDLWFVKPSGMSFAIELKLPTTGCSKDQTNLHLRLMTFGVLTYVCRSLDEVIATLLKQGVPLRDKNAGVKADVARAA